MFQDDLNNWTKKDFKDMFNLINENKKQKREQIQETEIQLLHETLQNNDFSFLE